MLNSLFAYAAFTLSGGLSQNPSAKFIQCVTQSITPWCKHHGLGSFPFARRYSGNRCFFLFLRLLRCFSSPGSPDMTMDSSYRRWSLSSGVSPFRNPRVKGYLLLAAAYRSLSRLSSAPSAKASALCSSLLGLSWQITLPTWTGLAYPSTLFFLDYSHCQLLLELTVKLNFYLISKRLYVWSFDDVIHFSI